MMRGQEAWSLAVRRPKGEIYLEKHSLAPLASRVRLFKLPFFRGDRRARRLPGHRRQGPGHLRQPGPRGGRAAHRQADGLVARARGGVLHRPVHPRPGRRDQLAVVAPAQQPDLQPGRGPGPARLLPALHPGHLDAAGHPAGVPVPRRRAHDDPLLRGQAPAGPGQRQPVPDPARPLRDQLPADPVRGHPDPVHGAVLGHRPPTPVRAGAAAAPGRAGDRRDRLRGHPPRRRPRALPAGQGADAARPVAADADHQAAHPRHDRGRHPLAGAGAAPGRAGPGRAPALPAGRRDRRTVEDRPAPRRRSGRRRRRTCRGAADHVRTARRDRADLRGRRAPARRPRGHRRPHPPGRSCRGATPSWARSSGRTGRGGRPATTWPPPASSCARSARPTAGRCWRRRSPTPRPARPPSRTSSAGRWSPRTPTTTRT